MNKCPLCRAEWPDLLVRLEGVKVLGLTSGLMPAIRWRIKRHRRRLRRAYGY